jgi:dihydropyrimidinase
VLDLAIRGGRVVTPHGVRDVDVGVRDGAIVGIGSLAQFDDAVDTTINAAGKLVLPGGIDPHVHAPPTGLPTKPGEPIAVAGPDRLSRAAIFGGTTTLIDFAFTEPDKPIEQSIREKAGHWQSSHCDYAFHVMLRGELDEATIEEIPHIVGAGYPSFKVFTTDTLPSRHGLVQVKIGQIREVMRALARSGGVLAIHAEDDDLVMHDYERLARAGDIGFERLPEIHSRLAEDLAFRRMITLARHIPGAALYFMHVTADVGVASIREARQRGLPVYGEVLHNFMTFTADAYRRRDGILYHTYPSLKFEADRSALLEGLVDRTLACTATDEGSTSRATKTEHSSALNARGGHVGIETRLGVTYTELVARRGVSLERFVDVVSTNAARLFGLYPLKGALAVGSDADITIFDPRPRTIHLAELHDADYSIWDGYTAAGWPETTLLRGQIVVDAERRQRASGQGRHVTNRKIDASIRSGPGL